MAGDSNEEGIIFLRKNDKRQFIGYSDSTLAELLGVDVKEYLSAKATMIAYDKISVDKNNVIKILKWNKYQSEYQRQKQYREKDEEYKKNQNKTAKGRSQAREKAPIIFKPICVNCKSSNTLLVHHLDKNPINNDIENLIYLCSSCHKMIHAYNNGDYKNKNKELKKKRESYKLSCNIESNFNNTVDIDIDKEGDKDKDKKKYIDDDVKLTNLLIEKILENNSKSRVKKMTDLQKESWFNECRLLRKDWKIKDIETVILFTQQDEFEKTVVLSMTKLRKRFDSLIMKCQREINRRSDLKVGSR